MCPNPVNTVSQCKCPLNIFVIIPARFLSEVLDVNISAMPTTVYKSFTSACIHSYFNKVSPQRKLTFFFWLYYWVVATLFMILKLSPLFVSGFWFLYVIRYLKLKSTREWILKVETASFLNVSYQLFTDSSIYFHLSAWSVFIFSFPCMVFILYAMSDFTLLLFIGEARSISH